MKINWIKQKVCNVLILVQQNYCLLFFRHHKYSRKTAVKFDMPLLIDT